MDSQQMMELLLAIREDTKAMNEKINETKEDMKTMQENIQVNLKKMMEEIMNRNQAKTDVKLEELSVAIEKTHVEREEPTSAYMNACQDAMEANLLEMEPTSGEKEAAVEGQKTPNEEVAIYSLRECAEETACTEAI
jgi:hypothetical protein